MRLVHSSLLLLCLMSMVLSQDLASQKYRSMENAFLLGLHDKGLEICHEILSNNEYLQVREDAYIFIAEKLMSVGIIENNREIIRQSYTLFKRYVAEFPNGKFINLARKRIDYLVNAFSVEIWFDELFSKYEVELQVVEKKLEFANLLININDPNVYELFINEFSVDNPDQILNKYLDEIIVNHPYFEKYAYYYKILVLLDPLTSEKFLSDGLFDFSQKKLLIYGQAYADRKYEAYQLLGKFQKKYPDHPLTLNLHLIFVNIFIEKSGSDVDVKTLYHLQYILKNDPDKLGIRYMLVKEYIESHEFEMD